MMRSWLELMLEAINGDKKVVLVSEAGGEGERREGGNRRVMGANEAQYPDFSDQMWCTGEVAKSQKVQVLI